MALRAIFLVVFSIAAGALGGCSIGLGTGTPNPSASFDRTAAIAAPVLFDVALGNQVLIFPSGVSIRSPQAIGTITQGVHRAVGLCVDRNGILYVLNSEPVTIAEYKPGSITPFKTITNAPLTAASIAVGADGTLYLTTKASGGIQVLVYPLDRSSPSRVIPIPTQAHTNPGALAFDGKGNLLVGTFHQIGDIGGPAYSIAPGSSTPIALNLQNPPGGAIGTDAAGNIYVGGPGGSIAVYPPGSKTPSRFIAAGNHDFYSFFSVTPNGTVYWPNFDDGNMYEFAPGASGPANRIEGGSGVDAAIGPR